MADRMASPGRPHAVEVAVEVDFEQCGRLVRGSPQFAGLGLEAQLAQVKAVAEGIYDASRCIGIGGESLRAGWRKGRTGGENGRFCAAWAQVAGVAGRRIKDSSFPYPCNG